MLASLSFAALLLACGASAVPSRATSAPASADAVRLELRVPVEIGARGTLIAIPYSAEEIASGAHESVSFFNEMLSRVQIVRDVEVSDGEATFDVELTAERRVVVVIFDGAGMGLEALFGPRGVGVGRVEVPPGASRASLTLTGVRPEPPSEACDGEREELLELDAPETQREGDGGRRVACVLVPPSYASSTERFPVVLVFPGYSGLATRGNVWRQRALFRAIGAELGAPAIVVGVATRTAEGSSYLQRSERFGDWDAFVVDRLLGELDARYRTNQRRGAIGHSTGGWAAIALATRHPDRVQVAAASSPDALDLDAWMLDEGGAVRAEWLAWMRAEHAMGGPGQFVSYGAAWSPDPAAPAGFLWPVDLRTGELAPEVYARWRAASPAADLTTDEGLARARALSGRLILTAGRTDEFGLFGPTERYVDALTAAGVETRWMPTELGHFGDDEARFAPLVRFLLTALASPLE